MTAPCSRLPAPRLLPGARCPPRLIVQEQDHRPNLPLREEVLPFGHRGVPGGPLARQAGSAFGDATEHEALRELRDRAVVLEVRRQRVEAGREVPLAVEVVPVTREAILVIDALSLRQIRR